MTGQSPPGEVERARQLQQVVRRWAWLPVLLIVFHLVYFAPALAAGRLLAPGDGAIYYLPFFGLSPLDLWNDDLLSGYPVLSDIQAQTFYPLRWLSPSFNVLVVSAYLVGSLGAFGLAYTLTRSRLGALMAALVFSGSGFMVAHLGHLTIIHAAAWIPVLLWAIASLRGTLHWGAVAGGAFATCFSLLGGHPQISVIGLLLAGMFAVHEIAASVAGNGVRAGVRMLARVTALFVLGLSMAAPSLLATVASATESVRSNWTDRDFDSYSHTLETLRITFFPNLYGAHGAGPYGAYAGPWNSVTELALYAGLLPWLLALVALAGWRRNRSHLFWAGALAVGLLLTLGTFTPLGAALFELPVVGQFRAQARFGLVCVIALSVLAAFGLSAVLRGGWSRRRSLVALGLTVLGGAALLFVAAASAANAGGWASPRIYVPLALLVASMVCLVALLRRPGFNTALVALVLLVVDLGSFGWFYEWRDAGPMSAPMTLDTRVQAQLHKMENEPGRVLPFRAQHQGIGPLRPNINLKYGIPSVVGYGPLLSSRYAQYTGADTTGGFGQVAPDAPVLDVLGVRWLADLEKGSAESQLLGTGCGAFGDIRAVRGIMPDGVEPSAIRIVSHMSCSQGIANAVTIAEVQLLASDGTLLQSSTLEAGEETAEWAYDRPDVKGSVAHARAPVAESFDAGGTQGLWFDANWKLARGLEGGKARSLQVKVRDGSPPLRIKSAWVTGADGSPPMQVMLGPVYDPATTRLQAPLALPELPILHERMGFRGLAWGVCAVRPAEAGTISAALQSAAGARAVGFDPFRVALVEPGQPLPRIDCRVPPSVRLLRTRHGYREMQVQSQGRSLLVVSDSYNSGWAAEIDGAPAQVVSVDGLVLGVAVPNGTHNVVLRYRPPYFKTCAALALLALAVTLLVGLLALLPRPGLVRIRRIS